MTHAHCKDELPFAVDEWSAAGSYVRDISRSSNLAVARAAYHAALMEYPSLHLKLRNRGLVLEEHEPGAPQRAEHEPLASRRAPQPASEPGRRARRR